MVSKKTLGFKKKDKKPANENDAAVREERLKLLKKAKEEYLAKHDNKKIMFRRINDQDMVERIKKNKEQYLLNYTKNKISIKEGDGYPVVWEDGFDQLFPRPVGVIDTTAVPSTSTSGTNVGAGDQTAQAAGTSAATDATDANAGPAAEVVTPTVDPAADATTAATDATAANAEATTEVVTPTVDPAADATTAATDATTTTTDGNVPPVVGASTESDAHQPPIAATTTATTPVQIEQPTPTLTVQQPPVAQPTPQPPVTQPTETTPINPQQQPHDVTTTSSGTDTGTTSSQHHDTTDDPWAGIGWRANYDPTMEPELDLAGLDSLRWQGLDTQRPVGGGSLSFADSQDMNADLQPHTIQHPAKPMSDINVQTQPNQLIRFLSKSGIILFTGGFGLAILITILVAVLMYSGIDITKHLTGQGI
ncbi:hypothetical protein NEHOM01_1234 [Nematocida homosporus]|uniref:uncharacterized protein n=1 Tax=Nematocida homosporus TaxID=1912981 RepID=UPI00221F3211|nr:uncharacterized protein NEHOM01_1234 [Nematocida homosporus]KAI5186031.1 hypothetical protein NEHOM01_1234 [Nematocida homosporus]